MPKVSVLMPLFNGKKYIEESLKSVQAQTFSDWEFIIINDFGSDDGCAEIVKKYAAEDPRIILVQTEKRLGLAASLNLGLDMAKGEYIARVDVDDPSYPNRFEKQVAYMDAHSEVSVCSSWQRSVTPDKSYIQKVASEQEELKAAMMFGCEISHCGVMLRKAKFDHYDWRYDSSYLGEDYELWTRIMFEGAKFYNIPEALVIHRWGFGNISISKGEALHNEVRTLSKRVIQRLGVDTDKYENTLFSGWRNKPTEFARKNISAFLKQGFLLVKEIENANKKLNLFDQVSLEKVLSDRWDWIRESCGLLFEKFDSQAFPKIDITPIVSVVLPTYNSANDISRSIDSVIKQTFREWELLVVNDYGSDDGTAEIVQMYAQNDPRIRLIQAPKRLGLAESLNLGIREARGKYIARLDADDTAYPQRFEKQVALMDARPEVGVCGAWQHHYGKNANWIHKAEANEEELRANLLFWCDLCHSTLMLRKDFFVKYQLLYNPDALAEDFELWTRAMQHMKIMNIPEVLGDYKEDGGITHSKYEAINEESGRITARTLKCYFDIDIPENQHVLLAGWDNNYYSGNGRREKLKQLEAIFLEVWKRNEECHFIDREALLQTLAKKWHWAKDSVDWKTERYRVIRIEDVFKEKKVKLLLRRYKCFIRNNPSMKIRLKKILKKLLRPLANIVRKVLRKSFAWIIDELKSSIEYWTWERFCRFDRKIMQFDEKVVQFDGKIMQLDSKVDLMGRSILSFNNFFIPYYSGQRIRVLFLFQGASFWPSWESFYQVCMADERIEVTFALLDEKFGDTTQMISAKDFLDEKKIPYVLYSDLLLVQLQPHVLIMQTPYDQWHRTEHVRSDYFRKAGVRIVYITYGIEIADTDEARRDHFQGDVVKNCWRMYTFSERMRLDYLVNSPNGVSVRSCGHPKFDSLFNATQITLPEEITEKASGRKIVLWHIHFPKLIPQRDGKFRMVTPYLEEYEAFAKFVQNTSELFFIVQPHPKFLDCKEPLRERAMAILNLIKVFPNAYIDYKDDYRPSLLNADCIISDRSALMVEAGAVGVPVLFMHNSDYYEPLTEAVKPLVQSYYQGTSCSDMIAFVEQCKQNKDPKKEQREAAFKQCIPFFDGKCGKRIANDIVHSLEKEANPFNLEEKIEKLEQQSDRVIKTLDARIWKGEIRQQKAQEELHRHIDYTYRDIMVVLEKQLEFVGKHNLMLHTDFPCAVNSLDHRHPRGTANDNTRYPRFIKRCETVFKKERGLSFLDLGCSGGGMVLDAVIRGHMAIGLEGSDLSLIQQRAEWRLLRENLFTCDIVKPFSLTNIGGKESKRFDVITAWEVLEHIAVDDLEQLFANIQSHLSYSGVFVASIACWDDIDPDTGVNWHVTVKPKEWWQMKFKEFGFEEVEGIFAVEDMARGGVNHPVCYRALLGTPNPNQNNEFVVLKKADAVKNKV